MLLVADSGSTKTQWLTETGELFETIGFNPHFHTKDSVLIAMAKDTKLKNISAKISAVFFYGAGCSSPERNAIIASALKDFFPAATIAVDHDLKAAAFATYNGKTCISCIIGTGSNSCLFDGENLTETVPALGYVLGDEGSGSWFGKELARAYLYHLLPEKTHLLFEAHCAKGKEEIFEKVYRQPYANVYLASFAKLLSVSPDKDFISGLVQRGFREFFRYHVVCYENYKSYPVHFVGSLAFHFSNELKTAAAEFDCRVQNISKEPVRELLKWHQKH